MKNILNILEKRGFIEAKTSEEVVEIADRPLAVYVGFDPTSDSLHLGNLIAIMGLAWFQRFGHTPIAIVGGATGMIGDPSGKNVERNLLDSQTLEHNLKGIRRSLEAVLKTDVLILNNYEWFQGFGFIEFLRDMFLKIALKADQPEERYSIKRFEELFGLRYFPHLEFSNWKTEKWVRQKCQKAHQKGKIGQLALWLGKLHGAQIDKAEIPDVTIRWMDEQIGYGLFTNRPLKKWEFIGEYTGILRQRNLLFPRLNDYCFMYPRHWLALKTLTIDGDQQGCFTRFINHSDYPNCESVSVFHGGIFHIIFRAIQDIPAGTELTYDYGNIYWLKRKKITEEPIETLITPEDLQKIQDLSKRPINSA